MVRALRAYKHTSGVTEARNATSQAERPMAQAKARRFITDAPTFLHTPELAHEVFGPSTLLVVCDTPEQMEEVAHSLEGQLTATIQGTPGRPARVPASDTPFWKPKWDACSSTASRRAWKSARPCSTAARIPPRPTAGPRPSARRPSTALPARCATRISLSDLLPPELQDANPRDLLRLVDNQYTRDAL